MLKKFESIFAGTIGAAVMALLLSPLIRSVDASYTPVPPGTITYFNSTTCPAGWSAFAAAQGLYVVGLPSGGTLGAAPGMTALTDRENRAAGIHAHTASSTIPGMTDPGHYHGMPVLGAGAGANFGLLSSAVGGPNAMSGSQILFTTGLTVGSTPQSVGVTNISLSAPAITVNNSAGIAGTNAPYIQLLVCSKS